MQEDTYEVIAPGSYHITQNKDDAWRVYNLLASRLKWQEIVWLFRNHEAVKSYSPSDVGTMDY